jgi:hypothetical protein
MIMRWAAVLLILFFASDSFAQKKKSAPVPKKPIVVPEIVEGFWLVTKVSVGPRDVTPVARWFKIEKGKQVSGNGWTQHSFGTYKFDKKKSELLFITANEPEDEFGAFKVERKGPLMTWSRKEERELVMVELKPITELPMSPSDHAKGLWVLDSAMDRDLDVTKTYDPDHKHFLFIRWDHQYVRQINAHERISGYWFFDALQPIVSFISENREQEDEQWTATIEGPKLTLKGSSENVREMTLVYSRATEFPK